MTITPATVKDRDDQDDERSGKIKTASALIGRHPSPDLRGMARDLRLAASAPNSFMGDPGLC
jgi:hypothetical protein